ncbi:PIN domain-containing protein [Kovacikia minuta CCNUW1]|uniref:type II toxin-antitoxin system VapC family toxin n=1 Tax=Kovacikia minuta TaxID=2931930 RepID=UPI001CCF6DE1|nr:PIN domain-containing protein [Kovacikia minuta]UBF25474.1 PIN domain-containing protein [Kovacikia minuta CCNUW1]
MQRIYLDVCCFNRPFDDQTQSRIRVESEAVLAILERCEMGEWELIISEMVEIEVTQIADQERRQRIEGALLMARSRILVDDIAVNRGEELQDLGFQGFDAIHLACAEIAQVDVFLSTDDRLLRRAARCGHFLTVAVDNPAIWLIETLQAGDSNNDPDGA